MIPPFADADDVGAFLQKQAADLPPGTDQLLMLASGVLASEFPLTASQDEVTDDVRVECAEMVARVLRNPEGVQQHQIGSFSEVFPAGDLGGALYVSAEGRRRLSRWKKAGAGTARIRSAYVEEISPSS